MLKLLQIVRPTLISVRLDTPYVRTACKGVSNKNSKLCYFYRESNGIDEYEIQVPIYPLDLLLFVNSNHDINAHISISPFDNKGVIMDQITADFVDFALDFCQRHDWLLYRDFGFAGKFNEYRDKKNQFVVRVYEALDSATPARIHVDENYIEINRSTFAPLTVYERFAIMLHEYSHNYIAVNKDLDFENPDNDCEHEADYWAMRIYKGLGFPKYEAAMAFKRIFDDHQYNNSRMANMIETLYNQ